MFKNFFKKTQAVSFFIGQEYDMTDSEKLHKILSETRIDESTAENLESAMKLVYQNGILSEMYSIEEGHYTDEEINFTDKILTYRDYPMRKFMTLAFDEHGMHQIGGSPPLDFQFPENNTITPYVYLGYLNNRDEILEWLPIEFLHLVCPIYSDMGELFLDYSSPMAPKLIRSGSQNIIGTAYEGLTPENTVEFLAYKASSKKHNLEIFYNGDILGYVGVPTFVQEDYIPKCPISGREMQFLIQLESNSKVKLAKTDIHLKTESYRKYFETLDFWGAGTLYIFIQPETKVVALYIQNT